MLHTLAMLAFSAVGGAISRLPCCLFCVVCQQALRCIVGDLQDEVTGKDYWIVKNSW